MISNERSKEPSKERSKGRSKERSKEHSKECSKERSKERLRKTLRNALKNALRNTYTKERKESMIHYEGRHGILIFWAMKNTKGTHKTFGIKKLKNYKSLPSEEYPIRPPKMTIT